MPLTAAEIDALFPPMSSANPTNSNINRALRISEGLAPLTFVEAGGTVAEPTPEGYQEPAPESEQSAKTDPRTKSKEAA